MYKRLATLVELSPIENENDHYFFSNVQTFLKTKRNKPDYISKIDNIPLTIAGLKKLKKYIHTQCKDILKVSHSKQSIRLFFNWLIMSDRPFFINGCPLSNNHYMVTIEGQSESFTGAYGRFRDMMSVAMADPEFLKSETFKEDFSQIVSVFKGLLNGIIDATIETMTSNFKSTLDSPFEFTKQTVHPSERILEHSPHFSDICSDIGNIIDKIENVSSTSLTFDTIDIEKEKVLETIYFLFFDKQLKQEPLSAASTARPDHPLGVSYLVDSYIQQSDTPSLQSHPLFWHFLLTFLCTDPSHQVAQCLRSHPDLSTHIRRLDSFHPDSPYDPNKWLDTLQSFTTELDNQTLSTYSFPDLPDKVALLDHIVMTSLSKSSGSPSVFFMPLNRFDQTAMTFKHGSITYRIVGIRSLDKSNHAVFALTPDSLADFRRHPFSMAIVVPDSMYSSVIQCDTFKSLKSKLIDKNILIPQNKGKRDLRSSQRKTYALLSFYCCLKHIHEIYYTFGTHSPTKKPPSFKPIPTPIKELIPAPIPTPPSSIATESQYELQKRIKELEAMVVNTPLDPTRDSSTAGTDRLAVIDSGVKLADSLHTDDVYLRQLCRHMSKVLELFNQPIENRHIEFIAPIFIKLDTFITEAFKTQQNMTDTPGVDSMFKALEKAIEFYNRIYDCRLFIEDAQTILTREPFRELSQCLPIKKALKHTRDILNSTVRRIVTCSEYLNDSAYKLSIFPNLISKPDLFVRHFDGLSGSQHTINAIASSLQSFSNEFYEDSNNPMVPKFRQLQDDMIRYSTLCTDAQATMKTLWSKQQAILNTRLIESNEPLFTVHSPPTAFEMMTVYRSSNSCSEFTSISQDTITHYKTNEKIWARSVLNTFFQRPIDDEWLGHFHSLPIISLVDSIYDLEWRSYIDALCERPEPIPQHFRTNLALVIHNFKGPVWPAPSDSEKSPVPLRLYELRQYNTIGFANYILTFPYLIHNLNKLDSLMSEAVKSLKKSRTPAFFKLLQPDYDARFNDEVTCFAIQQFNDYQISFFNAFTTHIKKNIPKKKAFFKCQTVSHIETLKKWLKTPIDFETLSREISAYFSDGNSLSSTFFSPVSMEIVKLKDFKGLSQLVQSGLDPSPYYHINTGFDSQLFTTDMNALITAFKPFCEEAFSAFLKPLTAVSKKIATLNHSTTHYKPFEELAPDLLKQTVFSHFISKLATRFQSTLPSRLPEHVITTFMALGSYYDYSGPFRGVRDLKSLTDSYFPDSAKERYLKELANGAEVHHLSLSIDDQQVSWMLDHHDPASLSKEVEQFISQPFFPMRTALISAYSEFRKSIRLRQPSDQGLFITSPVPVARPRQDYSQNHYPATMRGAFLRDIQNGSDERKLTDTHITAPPMHVDLLKAIRQGGSDENKSADATEPRPPRADLMSAIRNSTSSSVKDTADPRPPRAELMSAIRNSTSSSVKDTADPRPPRAELMSAIRNSSSSSVKDTADPRPPRAELMSAIRNSSSSSVTGLAEMTVETCSSLPVKQTIESSPFDAVAKALKEPATLLDRPAKTFNFELPRTLFSHSDSLSGLLSVLDDECSSDLYHSQRTHLLNQAQLECLQKQINNLRDMGVTIENWQDELSNVNIQIGNCMSHPNNRLMLSSLKEKQAKLQRLQDMQDTHQFKDIFPTPQALVDISDELRHPIYQLILIRYFMKKYEFRNNELFAPKCKSFFGEQRYTSLLAACTLIEKSPAKDANYAFGYCLAEWMQTKSELRETEASVPTDPTPFLTLMGIAERPEIYLKSVLGTLLEKTEEIQSKYGTLLTSPYSFLQSLESIKSEIEQMVQPKWCYDHQREIQKWISDELESHFYIPKPLIEMFKADASTNDNQKFPLKWS